MPDVFIFRLRFVLIFSCFATLNACRNADADTFGKDSESLRQVLYVQSLYNNHPGEDIVPELENVIDGMRDAGRNTYYFALFRSGQHPHRPSFL